MSSAKGLFLASLWLVLVARVVRAAPPPTTGLGGGSDEDADGDGDDDYSADDYKDSDDFTFLISGGMQVGKEMEYVKHMVSIRSRHPKRYFGDNHFCAGTIIGPTLVLTSAHCVIDKRRVVTRARRLLVVAGTPNRLRIVNTTRQYPVARVNVHPGFILNNTNDIAIIKLKYRIPSNNEGVKAIELADMHLPPGTPCTNLGWGRLYHRGPLAAKASFANTRLYGSRRCIHLAKNFKKGMICSATSEGGAPCRGDSGGPLICNDRLYGVISYTLGCDAEDIPSVYTDVFYHLDWIRGNAGRRPDPRRSLLLLLLLISCSLASMGLVNKAAGL